MAGSLYDLIPGLREAEERFRDEQLEAFTGIEPPICGIEVRPFTGRMFLELDGVGNDFFHKAKAPRVDHVAMFLWRVAREFDRENLMKRKAFLRRFRSVKYGEAVAGVREYLRRSYAPRPMVPEDANPSIMAWPASLVDIFAREYGWTEDVVLDLPLRRMWQYLCRILERKTRDFKQQCPEAMRLRAEWLQKQNATPAPQPASDRN